MSEYHRIKGELPDPRNFGLTDTENVSITSKSGNKIFGWKKKVANGSYKGSILYLHGSGGNRAWPCYRIKMLKILHLCGFNVLSVGMYILYIQSIMQKNK